MCSLKYIQVESKKPFNLCPRESAVQEMIGDTNKNCRLIKTQRHIYEFHNFALWQFLAPTTAIHGIQSINDKYQKQFIKY